MIKCETYCVFLRIPSDTPGCMEELLERQWEQGSQFLMEQGQHFDSKSCLGIESYLEKENQETLSREFHSGTDKVRIL